ncbi:MAG: hypothetical protein A3I78_05060 [Gammaproteobacteria bacterium RIFCSPLOWO2_02_FULL_56_15]|nr:MAG: hypothetical protein A3I78_05060 [Gammaproteobacteria bacterium RIFCSPLOWO2_02_FULL_56_15]
MRKYLIAGLLVWLPLGATYLILRMVVELLDRTILLLPPEYRPESLFGFNIPGLGLILALVILFLTGLLAANILGRKLVGLWENLLNRIPLVRTIYNSVKQITSTVLLTDNKAFSKVVLVEFPRKGAWSMGFLTSDVSVFGTTREEDRLAVVFVATTPNPTTGFLIAVKRTEIIELEMSIEEAVKYVMSMGVILPDHIFQGLKSANHLAESPPSS